MLRINRPIAEAGVNRGLVASVVLHTSLGVFMLFASDLFGASAPTEPVVIEVTMLRGAPEAERDALEPTSLETIEPEAAEPEPEIAAPETEEPQIPPTETPEAVPPETEPVETPPTDAVDAPDERQAPYETAPATPEQPVVPTAAQNDASPDAAIREELAVPAVNTQSEALEAPEQTDTALPDFSRETDRPDLLDDPCAPGAQAASLEDEEADAPAVPCPEDAAPTSAPDQPEFENQDEAPSRSEPDLAREGGEEVEPEPETAPENRPAPEAEASLAPETAPTPRRRPERAPEPEPVATPEQDDFLSGLENAVDAGAANAPSSENAPLDPIRGEPTSPPLSISERSALRFDLVGCWRRPPPGADPDLWTVVVDVDLTETGLLARDPQVVATGGAASAETREAAANAIAAINECAPYTSLPVEKYEHWERLRITFDPRQDGPSID